MPAGWCNRRIPALSPPRSPRSFPRSLPAPAVTPPSRAAGSCRLSPPLLSVCHPSPRPSPRYCTRSLCVSPNRLRKPPRQCPSQTGAIKSRLQSPALSPAPNPSPPRPRACLWFARQSELQAASEKMGHKVQRAAPGKRSPPPLVRHTCYRKRQSMAPHNSHRIPA